MQKDHEQALFATIRERLFTAAIGDVMDAAGLTHQFLPPEICALEPETILVGRAMPVLEADCCGDRIGATGEADPFGLMLRALDELQPGEVYVCAGATLRYALWGGLMSGRAKALGAQGAVLDGFHRDTREILTLGFPVFSRGAYAQDQRLRGRVIDFRCALEFANGARVYPGDVIVGDTDGVLAIPSNEAEDIVRAALRKVEGEAEVRERIKNGERAGAVFARTGIM
ncbi:MAG: RraA family protein [Acetobacteraceae bacterium]